MDMTQDELLLRRLAVCLSGIVYWVGVLWQARRVRKRIGRSPNLKPRGMRERLLWLGWFVVIVVWIGQPWLAGARRGLPGPWLEWMTVLVHPLGAVVGMLLLALGYAGTLWSYFAMGDTWRIGVNVKERTTLVQDGPYRWVRHPIYTFQIVMLAGALLLLPTPLSAAVLVFHAGCVLVKAADEERYLTAAHGAVYRTYCARTGRLWPRFLRH